MGVPIAYYARKYIEEGIDFIAAKVAATKGSAPRKRGAMLLMREDGQTVGTVGGGLLEAETEKLCRQMLQTGQKHMSREFILGGKSGEGENGEKSALDMGCGGDAVIDLRYVSAADPGDFAEELKVRDQAYIFGGGHVAKALEPLLRHIDFETRIIDDRKEYVNRDRFPDAAEVIVCSDFDHCFEEIEPDEESYLIIVTRGHKGDLAVLRQALRIPCAYIGMIGSRRKNGMLFDQLLREGVPEEDLARVHAPIGLDIGAETPEEIGVSVAAEIIQVRAGRIREEEKTDASALLHS